MKTKIVFVVVLILFSSGMVTEAVIIKRNSGEKGNQIAQSTIGRDNNIPKPNQEFVYVLNYNDYAVIWANNELGSDYKFPWSFEGSNSAVGITVYVMDDYNFDRFNNSLSYDIEEVLSDGGYYIDLGAFYPERTDQWYFVFWNQDISGTSTVTINLDILGVETITVSTPSTLETGQTNVAISWSNSYEDVTNPNPYVTIELYKGGSYQSTIAVSTDNDGSYTWSSVPETLTPGTNYQIRVSATTRTFIYDDSSYFEIEQWEGSVTADTPIGTFQTEEFLEIEWSPSYHGTNNNPYVKLELYKGDDLVQVIVDSTENDGSYQWLIPKSLKSSSEYKIKITSTNNPSVYDYSGNFEIKKPFPLTVVLIIGGVLVAAILGIVIIFAAKKSKERKASQPQQDPSVVKTPATPSSTTKEPVQTTTPTQTPTPTTASTPSTKPMFFCPHCGGAIVEKDKFCEHCGKSLKTEDKVKIQTPEVKSDTFTPTGKPDNFGVQMAWMVFVTIVQIIGLIMAAVKYAQKDKKAGMIYLLCGLGGVTLGIGISGLAGVAGIISGVAIVFSAWASGFRMISSGEAKLF